MNARSKAVAVGCSLVLAAALQTGCATTQKTTDSAPKAATPITQATPQSENQLITGKVVETMDSGGYTYVNLEKDGKRTWVAIPLLKVEVGQELKLLPGVQMGTFTSRTLNRTFDSIIFSYGVPKDNAPKKSGAATSADSQPSLPPGHPSMGQPAQPQGHPSAIPQSASSGSTISGKVVETMNSGGYTYVNLEKNGKKTWVAAPTMQVSVGQELKLTNGAVMTNFSSKSLNRTFDSIIFSGGPATDK
ncbi:MAG: hypothetical protein P4L44_10495 [Oryzomonas sp.]|uniref:hypothetical protein n=1 Tax=Oryzomonas sp. TaxID=2855186 RepID=UPI00283EBD2F|nr:hypothetical protein [Oryzomonas sp.]MDR3580380.1 hypothetical protein [Oryzomonas sp.]